MKVASDAPIRTSATGLDRILACGQPALVVFETPGCVPCQQLRPVLDDIAREFRERALVVRVTDAGEGWLAARYHLAFVPTLLFWRDGREQARIKGNAGREAVRAHLQYLLTGEVPPEPAEGPRHTLSACFGPLSPAVAREPLALLFAGQ
jgi:thioredoxin 1